MALGHWQVPKSETKSGERFSTNRKTVLPTSLLRQRLMVTSSRACLQIPAFPPNSCPSQILATKHLHPSTKQPEIARTVFRIFFFCCRARFLMLAKNGAAEVERWRGWRWHRTERRGRRRALRRASESAAVLCWVA